MSFKLSKLPLISLFLISAISLATLLNHPTPASASTTTFNIAAGSDSIAIGDGCRLSEAIVNINNSAQTHADCPAGVSNPSDINVISLPADTVTLTTDLPLITKPTNIIGQGKSVSVVDGADNSAFEVSTGSSYSGVSLEYRDFTVKNVANSLSFGAIDCLSILVDSAGYIGVDNVDAIDCGYASFQLGSFPGSGSSGYPAPDISVSNSNISRTSGPNGASNGIRIVGSPNTTVSSVSIVGNTSGLVFWATPGNPDATALVSNSTFVDNSRALGVASNSNNSSPTDISLTLANNTVYSNYWSEASSGVGILLESIISGSNIALSLQNNIIASNGKALGSGGPSLNCYQTGDGTITITSLGNNLSDNGCLTSFGPNDILSSDIDSTISALADNGGAVKTLALKAGSPAIDTAATVDSITTDARGFLRPFGVAYDIGAYEYGSTDPNPPETPPPNPPKTGRIAIAIVLTTVILSSVLLLARAYEKKYHVGTGEK